MKTLILTILLALIILSTPLSTLAQGPQQDVLRYNPMSDKWSYEQPDSRLKYNPMIDSDNDNNKWTYEDPNSQLRYNPMSDKWDYAR